MGNMVPDTSRDKSQASVHKSLGTSYKGLPQTYAMPIIVNNGANQSSSSTLFSSNSNQEVHQSLADTLPSSSYKSPIQISADTFPLKTSKSSVLQSSVSAVQGASSVLTCQLSSNAAIAVRSQRNSFFNHIIHPPTTTTSPLWRQNADRLPASDNRRVSIGGESSAGHQSTCEEGEPNPLDGGYGWVIVFASFCTNMIADGLGFSFGVLFAELVEVFGESRGNTAWVGSLFVAMPMICGPIASAFTDRFGCRWTMIAGGIIATVGCFSSAFVASISVLCLTFGFVAGFGLSLVFLPSFLIVALYFKEKRAFATGLSVAGAGIGTLIFAPLTEALIDAYCWRGAMMILAGFMLNAVVCGALLRPLPPCVRRSNIHLENTNSRTAPSVSRDLTLVHRFVLRCRPTVNDSGGADLGSSTRHGSRAQLMGSQDVIYFEPVTRSVIQFPTYLICEWETQAPSLLEELDLRSMENKSTSLLELFAARNMLDRFHVTVESLEEVIRTPSMTTISSSRTSSSSSSSSSISDSGSSRDKSRDRSPRRRPRTRVPRPRTLLTIKQPHASEVRRKQRSKPRRRGHRRSVDDQSAARGSTPTRRAVWCRRVCGKLFGRCRLRRKKLKDDGPPRDVDVADDATRTGRHHIIRSSYVGRSKERFTMISRRDVFYRGGLLKAKYMINARSIPSASCPALYDVKRVSDDGRTLYWSRLLAVRWFYCLRQLLAVFDFSVFSSAVFNYFCLHSFFLFVAYDIPYVYIPDVASNFGVEDSSSAYLVSVIGLGNTIGQIIMGYVGDLPKVNTLLLYVITSMAAGLITPFVPLLHQYWTLAIYCFLYGVLISANYALTTIILVDLIGMKQLGNGFGFVSLCEGLANLVGPPLAGMLFDSSGSYDLTFILSGTSIVVSGVMLLAMPWISRRDERRRLQRLSKLRKSKRPTVAVKSTVSSQSRPRSRTSLESYSAAETSSILRHGKPRPSISD